MRRRVARRCAAKISLGSTSSLSKKRYAALAWCHSASCAEGMDCAGCSLKQAAMRTKRWVRRASPRLASPSSAHAHSSALDPVAIVGALRRPEPKSWVNSGNRPKPFDTFRLARICGERVALNPRNVQRFLDSALKKAGLPDVRFHDLRHTAGTLLMRHDGRVVAAQHRLGHARPSTTLNLYGHALPGDQRQATEHMLEAIERERRRNASTPER